MPNELISEKFFSTTRQRKIQNQKVFTAEDHSIIGGLRSVIAELIAESGVNSKLIRIGVRDEFRESGKPDDLLRKYKLDGKGIAGQVLGKL